jgi:hypothetical protein
MVSPTFIYGQLHGVSPWQNIHTFGFTVDKQNGRPYPGKLRQLHLKDPPPEAVQAQEIRAAEPYSAMGYTQYGYKPGTRRESPIGVEDCTCDRLRRSAVTHLARAHDLSCGFDRPGHSELALTFHRHFDASLAYRLQLSTESTVMNFSAPDARRPRQQSRADPPPPHDPTTGPTSAPVLLVLTTLCLG